MKKIVLIGGCGYIGSQLFTSLVKKKYIVDTVDTEWFGNYINPNNIKLDYSELPKSFFNTYDAVVLLAGHSTVGMCEENKLAALKNNVENFVRLIEKLKKQKFIYASTYRLYDGITGHPVNETENQQDPNSFYSLTKKTIDYYASMSQVEFYGLRMATVNGYSPNLRTNQIINKLFLNFKSGKKISISDPDAVFSVLGINDLCRGIEKIILGEDKRGVYNLGSTNTSITSILKELSFSFEETPPVTKKPSTTRYHMQISTKKFQEAYDFSFLESSKSIIESLLKNVSKDTHLLSSP